MTSDAILVQIVLLAPAHACLWVASMHNLKNIWSQVLQPCPHKMTVLLVLLMCLT